MLELLRSLFGAGKTPTAATKPATAPPAAPAAGFARLNELAPLKVAPAVDAAQGGKTGEPRPTSSFVCREAVLNRSERIAGYEFSLHRRLHPRFKDQRPLIRKVYDDALVRDLASLTLGNLLGHRLAFIDLAPASLDNPQLASLPAGNAVLLIDPPTDFQADAGQLAPKLAAARAHGFRLGWRLRQHANVPGELLAACDFIQILTPDFDGLQLADLVRRLRAQPRPADAAPLQILASDLGAYDDFHLCFRAGFDFFQGPFIASRENWHPPKSEIDRSRVIALLNQVRSGAENSELAAGTRQDPVLTFKLLRYINSPAIGLQTKITAIDQGLVVLGREKFYRWLSLLLFDVHRGSFTERALIEQALVRARLLERLGEATGANADHCFLTGLFSLLDALLGQPLEQVVGQVAVPDSVKQALLTRQGPLAPLLNLAIASESGDAEEIAAQAAACGLDAGLVNRHLLGSLVWAQEVAQITE